VVKNFDKIDADKKGYVTEPEIKTAMATAKATKAAKTVYDPKDDKDFPKDMAITGGANWTDALDGFTFSITERKKKELFLQRLNRTLKAMRR